MTQTTIRRSLAFLFAALLVGGAAFAQHVTSFGSATQVTWQADFQHAGMALTVTGPDDFVFQHTFDGNASFSVFDDQGYNLSDGDYRWHLTVLPVLSDAVREDLAAARAAGDDAWGDQLLRSGAIQSAKANGFFRVVGGTIVTPSDEVEPQSAPAPAPVDKSAGDGGAVARAQVFTTDLIVQGSACVGFDCSTSESFGSDTIRLKENNLRIHFDDTSSSGSFPRNDWRLIANDTSNGGDSYFAIQDATGNATPFKIEAGAGNNSLYVDSNERIGNTTAAPVVNLHVVEGNTPTLRLEQDGSSGFQSQTWDIAGNESNFFIRDVTNSSELPFRIEPGASDDSIYIDSTGNIGLGVTNPSASLQVKRTGASDTASLVVENTNTTSGDATVEVVSSGGTASLTLDSTGTSSGATREMLILENNGFPRIVLDNSATSGSGSENGRWFFGLNANDDFVVSLDGTSKNELRIDENGDTYIQGTLFEVSDVNAKSDIVQVDPRQVLETLSSLPIATWRYNDDDPSVRHMGPMAQDFRAAFGLGDAETRIATVDKDGVALAAIQGLNQVVTEKQAEVDELKARVAALEALIQSMAEANGQ